MRDSENYRKEGDLIVVSDHVAVGYGPSHDLRIIDFGAREDTPYRRITLIDDYRAIAMFYSNRGAEQLRSGRYAEALDWLRSSVAIDPEYAGSWVNLGVAHRRSGDVENAEISYRTALEARPALDLRAAEPGGAAALQGPGGRGSRPAWRWPTAPYNRNPFTYLSLGDLHMRHGRMAEAGRFYRKALKRQGENAESLAAMGCGASSRATRRRPAAWLKRAEGPRQGSGPRRAAAAATLGSARDLSLGTTRDGECLDRRRRARRPPRRRR